MFTVDGTLTPRLLRLMLPAWLCLMVPVRVLYLHPDTVAWTIATNVAVVLLLWVLTLPWVRRLPRGRLIVLVAALAAAVYLPEMVLTEAWAGTVSWALAGALLLVVRAPASWLLFALVVAGEVSIRALFAPDFDNAVLMLPWAANIAATYGIAVYAMTRLADTAGELRATRTEAAGLARRRERTQAARGLRGAIGTGLLAVMEHSGRAMRLLGTDDVAARAAIGAALTRARRALAEARALATHPTTTGPHRSESVRPGVRIRTEAVSRWTPIALIVIISGWGLMALVNLTYAASGAALAGSVVLVLAGVATHLYTIVPRASGAGPGAGGGHWPCRPSSFWPSRRWPRVSRR